MDSAASRSQLAVITEHSVRREGQKYNDAIELFSMPLTNIDRFL